MLVTYSSNNSGGSWWLNDQDWYNLEKAGWTVKWVKDQEHYKRFSAAKKPDWDGRWLGCLAKEATLECESVDVAIAKWEHVTGQNASDEGCNCCGAPHDFHEAYEYEG